MPKRKDSFSRALADAKARLVKCQTQREVTRKLLATLDVEIPLLQHTVAALEMQVNPTLPAPIIPMVSDAVFANRDVVPSAEPTENDLLPEPEGTPVVPED